MVDPDVEEWFVRRTWQRPEWREGELANAKRGRRVSVVLPALNEQHTVGDVVSTLVPLTDPAAGDGPLVDELVVLDSGSTDATRQVAERAGARVVGREEVLTDFDIRPGKGEVLWRALAATAGDVLVFVDADLVACDRRIVPALLGPLLTSSGPVLVKGFSRRRGGPAGTDGVDGTDTGGGRVTELLARPVLSALFPQLRAMVSPLGGEYAATREFLEAVPFAPGYGVEIGLLLDAYASYGLDGLAQVNLGVRRHRHHGLLALGVMARQVLDAALRRSGCGSADADITRFTQFDTDSGAAIPRAAEVLSAERPPLREIAAEYLSAPSNAHHRLERVGHEALE